jgi:uncharacterized membrane protein YhaH (DUF805 family)
MGLGLNHWPIEGLCRIRWHGVIEASMTTETARPFSAFFFPDRIGRVSYILRLIVLAIIYGLGFWVINLFRNETTFLDVMVIAFAVLFLTYLFCFVVMPRLRDFGLPGLAVILFLYTNS